MKYPLKGHAHFSFNVEDVAVNMCATFAAPRLPPEVEHEVVRIYGRGSPARLVFAYFFPPKEGAAQWIDVADCYFIDLYDCEPEEGGAACEIDWYIRKASSRVNGMAYFAEGVFVPGELIHGLVAAIPSPNCRCLYRAVLFPYAPKSRLFLDLDAPEYKPLLEEIFDALERAGLDISRDRAVLKALEDPGWEEWAEERCRRLAAETAAYSLQPVYAGGRPECARTREPEEAIEKKARVYFKQCPKWRRAALEGARRPPA